MWSYHLRDAVCVEAEDAAAAQQEVEARDTPHLMDHSEGASENTKAAIIIIFSTQTPPILNFS